MTNPPFPEAPEISNDVAEAARRGDPMPLLFIWSCHVVEICRYFAALEPLNEQSRGLPRIHYLALTGLLFRCSNLLNAMLHLMSERDYGDAFRILARSTSESAIKIMWLSGGDEERFGRFFADGLKAELELRQQTESNIAERGWALPIEGRLLESISKVLAFCGLSAAEIKNTKKLPDIASMFADVGVPRLSYVASYKLGSQATHGTWLDIVVSYLGTSAEGELGLNLGRVIPDAGILGEAALLVLEAIALFTDHYIDYNQNGELLFAPIERAARELHGGLATIYPEDYQVVWSLRQARRHRTDEPAG